jgi:AcrR family transcriptional regulator
MARREQTNGGSAGPGRPRSESADRAILEASIELLAQRGLRGLTLEGVAERAGCSKTTIYRRWPSKLHLVVEAVAQLPPLPEPETGELAGDLRQLLRRFVAILASTPLSRVMPTLVAESSHDPELAELLIPLWRARREPLRRALERGILRGELPSDLDRELAIDLLMGPLLARLFFGEGKLARADADRIVAAALAGLTARPARSRARLTRRQR